MGLILISAGVYVLYKYEKSLEGWRIACLMYCTYQWLK